jgi:hypothetical protein
LIAEVDKPERERGTCLSPKAFNQPEGRPVEWARHPELMRQMKGTGEQMKQRAQADNR